MIDERIKQVWEQMMALLDDNKVSKSEAMFLSDMLYSIASSKASENSNLPASFGEYIFFKKDYGFENIPYLKSRWGLDPSLIKDDN